MNRIQIAIIIVAAVILASTLAVTVTSAVLALEPGTYHVHTQNGVNGGGNDGNHNGNTNGHDKTPGDLRVKPVEGWKRG
jgi:hypothetical protein